MHILLYMITLPVLCLAAIKNLLTYLPTRLTPTTVTGFIHWVTESRLKSENDDITCNKAN